MRPAAAAPDLGHESTELETAIDSRATSWILGLSPITLQQLLAPGDRPPSFRIGRTVHYRLGDVIAWRDVRIIGRKLS